MSYEDPRAALSRLVGQHGTSLARLSAMLGRNPAYLQQYLRKGSPRRLPEAERRTLATFFGVAEDVLGDAGQADRLPVRSGMAPARMRAVPRLAVDASAGPGGLAQDDAVAGLFQIDEQWLRDHGLAAARLSIIEVSGDSMEPALSDGDAILVDTAPVPLRDGVHVVRMGDALLVKRLARKPGGRIAVLSDNSAYPGFPDCDPAEVQVIGRVVRAIRRV